ncbi:hypothetical protein B4U80_11259 [Leptotrombidium deliense]|uniref:ATP synthase subunit g-like protein n=1 Tax=Leptotrombidium deliense TaxID=299467 RepID=A0A443S939_9ACAR|nr:hypothetical protein B4U80_11259 [Leptotrombidium deliense]
MSKLIQLVQKQGPTYAKKAVDYSKPRLQTFLYYAKTELTPPLPTDIPAIVRGFSNLIKSATLARYRHLTVREAWKNTLVTVEVACWFFVGELSCIVFKD